MSKISIQITGKGLIFKKGRGQFTVPLEGSNEQEAKGPKKIYYVDQEVADKIRPSLSRITYRKRIGTVVSKPVYKKYLNYGFWYADIEWEDGIIETFNLNKMGIELQL